MRHRPGKEPSPRTINRRISLQLVELERRVGADQRAQQVHWDGTANQSQSGGQFVVVGGCALGQPTWEESSSSVWTGSELVLLGGGFSSAGGSTVSGRYRP